jgi:hypothetical protein
MHDLSPLRRFLIMFVAGTIFGVLWPERMAKNRRRITSLKGIAQETLIPVGTRYFMAWLTRPDRGDPAEQERAARDPVKPRLLGAPRVA